MREDEEGNEVEVLIVPLWNWNYNKVDSEEQRVCSNRTFMELKLFYKVSDVRKMVF